MPMTGSRKERMVEATSDDQFLQQIKAHVIIGRLNIHAVFQNNFHFLTRNAIGWCEDTLFNGAHHCVMKFTKTFSNEEREVFFWPGMTVAIKDGISTCIACCTSDKDQPFQYSFRIRQTRADKPLYCDSISSKTFSVT